MNKNTLIKVFNLALLLVLVGSLGYLLFINFDTGREGENDFSVTGATVGVWEACGGETGNTCGTGLTCVQTNENVAVCSPLTNLHACDAQTSCTDGSTCAQYQVYSNVNDPASEYLVYRCSKGELNDHCNANSDCISGYTCADIDGMHMPKRCISQNQAERGQWSHCSSQFACAAGFSCETWVSTAEEIPHCSNLEEGAACTANSGSQCDPGLSCQAENGSTVIFKCQAAPGAEQVACGKLDANNSGRVDLYDFDNLIRKWGAQCTDT